MGDLALLRRNDEPWDIAAADGDLIVDAGLRTPVIVSAFTDRRAAPDDALPHGESDRRGWWGDGRLERAADGARLGSRLWLLVRAKQTPRTRQRWAHYWRECLAWLVETGRAAAVAVDGEWVGLGRLRGQVRIIRPDGETHRFSPMWDADAPEPNARGSL